MASVRVPGFTPSEKGLLFANRFPSTPAISVGIPRYAVLGIGNAADGLCGGMSYTTRDLFERGIAPPPDQSPPESGTPRFEYLVARQVDSFDFGRVPLRFYDLGSPTRPASETDLTRAMGRLGIDRHSRGWVMVKGEWPKIRADLDASSLSMLGLVRVVSADPRQLGLNHQVVAYGYDLEPSHLTLFIYDPNWPARDDVRIELAIDDTRTTATATYSTGEPLVCFFRAPYSWKDPVPWRSP